MRSQLKCVGGNARGLYDVDILQCKNHGSDYDGENIQWTCSASLPLEFKLGSTDVICEGFASSSDTYVLKGSCGVEYRLILTNAGEEKYGRREENIWRDYEGKGNKDWSAIIFWCIFIIIVGWMLYSAFIKNYPNRQTLEDTGNPWGGGDGGGSGRPGYDEPPPPYDYRPTSTPKTSRAIPTAGQAGWSPGFWTGAGLGGAVAYIAGNRGQDQSPRNRSWFGNQQQNGDSYEWAGNRYNDNGEGSSSRQRPSASSSSSFSSTRYEGSGFGSTNRR